MDTLKSPAADDGWIPGVIDRHGTRTSARRNASGRQVLLRPESSRIVPEMTEINSARFRKVISIDFNLIRIIWYQKIPQDPEILDKFRIILENSVRIHRIIPKIQNESWNLNNFSQVQKNPERIYQSISTTLKQSCRILKKSMRVSQKSRFKGLIN